MSPIKNSRFGWLSGRVLIPLVVLVSGSFAMPLQAVESADKQPPGLQPSVQEAQNAMLAALASSQTVDEKEKSTIRKNLKVDAVQACFPAAETKTDARVCVIDIIDQSSAAKEKERITVPMSYRAGKWTVVVDGKGEPLRLDPACPSGQQAQALLHGLGKLTTIELEERNDPTGVFSEARGLTRNKKGPYRLMCVYTGHQKKLSAEWTIITYIWMKNGQYTMDADYEALPD